MRVGNKFWHIFHYSVGDFIFHDFQINMRDVICKHVYEWWFAISMLWLTVYNYTHRDPIDARPNCFISIAIHKWFCDYLGLDNYFKQCCHDLRKYLSDDLCNISHTFEKSILMVFIRLANDFAQRRHINFALSFPIGYCIIIYKQLNN